MATNASLEHRPMSRPKAWGILITTLCALWLFAVAVGPWLQHHIYSMDDIVQVIETNGIDSGAYYYTEIEGAYAGREYLRQSLEIARPEEYGLTLPFISGIIVCIALLGIGFKYLPE